MGSVTRKAESETVAQNIAIVLSETGNTFRLLPFVEYEQARRKDDASDRDILIEKPYFEQVVRHLETEQTARLFSPCWDI